MKRFLNAIGGVVLLMLLTSQLPAAAQAEKETITKTNLKVGDTAPDFTLLGNDWKPVKLSDYRGKKNVILAFYVLAFTGG